MRQRLSLFPSGSEQEKRDLELKNTKLEEEIAKLKSKFEYHHKNKGNIRQQTSKLTSDNSCWHAQSIRHKL